MRPIRPPAEATRYVLDHMSDLSPPAAVVALTAIAEEMAAELEAARPVVEAAQEWRRYVSVKNLVGMQARWTRKLLAAVDLYRSATSDHPSTTEEKP